MNDFDSEGRPTNEALTRKHSLRDLVVEFDAKSAVIRRCFAELREAEKSLSAHFTLGGSHEINIIAGHHGRYSDWDADHAIKKIAIECWEFIVERMELRRAMSAADWEALQKRIAAGEMPPISHESIADFARRWASDLPETFAKAIAEVFDFLRPRNDRYATNTELEIGPKVILEGVVCFSRYGDGKPDLSEWYRQRFIALENVFSGLTGSGTISRGYYSALQTAIEKGRFGERVQTEHFEAVAFKKGTLHITIRNAKALAELNRRAGGMRLRPGAEVAA